MFELSPYSLPTLIGSILPLSLFVTILLSKKKDASILTFLGFLACMFFYLITYTITYSIQEENIARFFAKMACVAVFLTAPFFYNFGVSFLNIEKEKKYVLIIWTIAIIFLPFFVIGDAFLSTSRHWWGWYSKAGPLHPISLIIWYGVLLRFFYLLFKTYFNSKRLPMLHQQTKLVIISFLILSVASIDYAPKYGADFFPFGWAFALVGSAILSYTIFKYRLFNLKVAVTTFFTITIWLVFFGRVLLTTNPTQRLVDGSLFVFVVVFGVLLIKSVNKEVAQKEELADLNLHLEEKVAEQTIEVRKSYEVEKKARIELEELNHAKNDFVLASQHNLRTPLTITKGYVDEIGAKTQNLNDSELKTFIDKTKNSLDILAQLINGLIDVTDLKVGKEGFSKKEKN